MYQELYENLPDREEYLKRIGASLPETLDLDALNRLIYAHHCSVPFENLDVFPFGKEINLGIEALYDKIVRRRRGGYCFELNGLFVVLLRECGFDAYSCRCRVVRGKDYVPPSLHEGILARLQGELWFCDVGYGGPMPAGALRVEDGFVGEYCGQAFGMRKFDEEWWTIDYRSEKGAEDVIQFTTQVYDPVEFLLPNEYCSKNEKSVFVDKRVVNIRTKDGNCSVTDDLFVEVVDGVRKERMIGSEEELGKILRRYFGIDFREISIVKHF